jgi:hypothetical protein
MSAKTRKNKWISFGTGGGYGSETKICAVHILAPINRIDRFSKNVKKIFIHIQYKRFSFLNAE